VLDRLAEAIMARPRAVLMMWALVTAICGLAAVGLFGQLGNGGYFVEESDSGRVVAVLNDHFPDRRGTELFVAIAARSPSPAAADGYTRALKLRDRKSEQVIAALNQVPQVVAARELVTKRFRNDDRGLDDESVAVIGVYLALDATESQEHLPELRRAVDGIGGPLVSIALVGDAVVSERYAELARQDLARAELIALPVIFALLLIAFLSAIAAALPLLLAVVTLAITSAMLYLLGFYVDLSVFVTNTAAALALGLSIDFSLFMVTRLREEMRGGLSLERALKRTMATTGRAIVLSSLTIATAALSLLAVGTGLFTSMAIAATVATLVAVLTAITLLPAVLCLLGPRLERFTFRHAADAARRATLWQRLANAVTAHPVPAIAASLIVLVAMAFPALDLRIDFQASSALPPNDPVSQEIRHLTEGLGPGAAGLVEIVTRSSSDDLEETIEKDPNVSLIWLRSEGQGGWSSLRVILESAPDDQAARATVRRLRGELASSEGVVYVGGLTAAGIDLTDRIAARTPAVVLIAVVLGFLALALGLRSIVVPIKAVLSTLLSVAATLGLLVLLFPNGPGAPSLEFFVPLCIFAIVFGLSVDYEVFLLSRIREAALDGKSTAESVRLGLIRSGRSITLAGLTLATVFAAFGASSLDVFRQLGVGVAIAVLLDVTIVRCVLIPASTVVLGKWNWWFPGAAKLGHRSALVPPLSEIRAVEAVAGDEQLDGTREDPHVEQQ